MTPFESELPKYGILGLVILALGIAFVAYWKLSEKKLELLSKSIETLQAQRVADQAQRVADTQAMQAQRVLDAQAVTAQVLKTNEGMLTAMAATTRSIDANTVALTELRVAEKDQIEELAALRTEIRDRLPPRRS